MTGNLINQSSEIQWVIASVLVLCAFAVALALPQAGRRKSASRGHRPEEDESTSEEIRPDGYIDSFSGEIEEAGGGIPPVMKLAVPVVIIWWLLYIVLNWSSIPGGQ